MTPADRGQTGNLTRAFRASILHCLEAPDPLAPMDAIQYIEDGVLLISDGRVEAVGEAKTVLGAADHDIAVTDWRGHLIVPGFVDVHLHYAQTDIIASYGERLLEWLEQYALPAEMRYADPGICKESAAFFLDELARNGTTTACVFGTVHEASVDALMQEARRRRLRMIAGKVLMDRNCPDELREESAAGIKASAALIERWHGKDRLAYALTPRFAPTSSRAQLEAVGELLASRAGLYLQTHMAESRKEAEWVARLFPEAPNYLAVYSRAGLVGPRSVLAHCIHIDDDDRERIHAADASIAFCPGSNLFLGSGLFDYRAARQVGIRVGIGTDVGAGPRFSVPATAAEGYKVARTAGLPLGPFEAFYLSTLGGARALHLDDAIGNFVNGKEADFVVLDLNATPLLARRTASAADVSEQLFAMFMLGDDRVVAATYILGEEAHVRD